MSQLDQRIRELEEQLDNGTLEAGLEKHVQSYERRIGDETANFTIKCEDQEWKCHRVVLAKCGFFKACFRSGFKENTEGIMTMEDDDPQSIGLLLHFLYTGDPSPIHRNSLQVHEVLERNVNAFVVANKYDIRNLKVRAMGNIRFEIALVEENLGSKDRRSRARLTSLVETLRAIYDDESDQLVLEEIKQEILKILTTLPRLWSECEEIDVLMGESLAFRKDLLKGIAKVMAVKDEEVERLSTQTLDLQNLTAGLRSQMEKEREYYQEHRDEVTRTIDQMRVRINAAGF